MNREINDLLRLAAGHVPRDRAADRRGREGRIGIGVGGAAGAPRVVDDVAAQFNAELRLSAGIVRGRYRAADLIGN